MELLKSIESFYSPAPEGGAPGTPVSGPAPELEFPVNAAANWPQTLIGTQVMLMRCEANLRFRNSSPDHARRRLAAKCPVEFILS